jgi:deoxyhypusine synthase
MKRKNTFLRGSKINPRPIRKNISVTDLLDNHFQAYNSARIREAAQLFANKMLKRNVTVGLTMTGALTPAGLGGSCIVPLIKAGFVDWIVSTGANLYHDTHFAIGKTLRKGSPQFDDTQLRKQSVIRIYDIVFDYDVLLDTDAFFRKLIDLPEFQMDMSTSEFHHTVGKYVFEREKKLRLSYGSMLGTAYKYDVPIYTSSPGDSSIGMNAAARALYDNKLRFDVLADVNETAAIVLDAKRSGGKSGVVIFGGGSPKNFILQTEPHIQEILDIKERGHDYFVQVTDARPDTGGLSGATPSEAVSWGKIDPHQLPGTVVAYVDSTIAMPIVTSYVLAKAKPRKPRRLFARRDALLKNLKKEADKANNRS